MGKLVCGQNGIARPRAYRLSKAVYDNFEEYCYSA